MNEAEFSRQISRAWDLFRGNLEIDRAFIWTRSLRVDEVFRDCALDPEATYSDIYRTGLSRSAYNFLLSDYAYFQFSWINDHSWRMAYFPNPWITGVADAKRQLASWELLEEAGAVSNEEAAELIEEIPYQGAVPPIRFEYSSAQYREVAHPAAHFHIGRNADNRWPCAILLGPLGFSMLIAKLYYPEQWSRLSSFEGGNADECIELRFAEVVQASQIVHDFSDTERRMLHLGRHIR